MRHRFRFAGFWSLLNLAYDVRAPLNSTRRGFLTMSDRKYRQSGYMDQPRDSERRPKSQSQPQSKPPEREGPRSPKMMAFGQKVKCAACGATVEANVSVDAECPKCKASLHNCRICSFFDPGARFECRKTIPARIVNKSARNDCDLFAARTVVERETSSSRSNDPRQAFAKLFKK
jgi:hypothetical protein